MQNRLNIRILHIALLFLLSAGCLLPHAAYATPLQDDLIAIRTAMQAELASDRDYGEMNRQAKTFEERLAILRLQQAEAESIVRHLRQIKMHSKEGRIIRDKMAGSFEKISNRIRAFSQKKMVAYPCSRFFRTSSPRTVRNGR